jgi:hypothetical protein
LSRRVPFVLWLSYGLVVSVLAIPALLNDRINGDIFWQRWLGEQILATHRIPTHLGPETLSASGVAWVPQEWLLSVALALAQRTNTFALLAVAAVLSVVATMLLAGLRARRRGTRSTVLLALCAILIGMSARGTFGVRAQVFAWPLFAVLLLLLDGGGPDVWWCVPLTAIWSNVHASVVLAPAMAFIYAVGSGVDARAWTPRVTRYALLVPALLLASCLNPLGWHIPLYALSLESSPIHSFISEWQPLRISDYGLWLLVIPVLAGLAIAVWRGVRLTAVDALVTLACGYLTVTALRNLPIFAIAVAPIACANLSRMLPTQPPQKERPMERALQVLLAAIALPLVAWSTYVHSDYPRAEAVLPARAVGYLASLPGPKRLFCFDFGACSLVLGLDGIQTFMDGRCDPFPLSVWQRYRTLIDARPGWSGILSAYAITFVLAPNDSPLARAIDGSGQWNRIYSDDANALYARKSRHPGTAT